MAASINTTALAAIKIIGSLFLLYLAFSALRTVFGKSSSDPGGLLAKTTNEKPILTGFLAEVTNPEAIILFTTVFSGVSAIGGLAFHVVVAGVAIVVMTTLYYTGLAFLASSHKLAKYGRRHNKTIAIVSAAVYVILSGLILYSTIK